MSTLALSLSFSFTFEAILAATRIERESKREYFAALRVVTLERARND